MKDIVSIPADQSSEVTLLAYYDDACRAVAEAKNVDDVIRHEVQRHWVHALQRRGQRQRFSWVYLSDRPWFELPSARTLHPAV
jgi:hypothetical protein